MNRVLTTPQLASAEHHLASPGWHADASTQAHLDQVEADAYRRGHADGEAAATTRAAEAAERATAAVRPLLDQLVTELARLHDDRVRADVELALAIAEHVVGIVPGLDAEDLIGRVRSAVDQLTDPDLEVRVHPRQAELLATRLAGHGARNLEVVADADVTPGEAHVAGRWGRAELTRAAALTAVRDALTAEAEDRDA